jgi:hypothetical protein
MPETPEHPAATAAPERRVRPLRQALLAALLAVAVVLAAVVLVRMLGGDDPAGSPDGNTPEASGAVIVSDSVKRAALVAATDATQKVLSYSHASLDEDVEAARALLAGEMLEQYDDTMAGIRPRTGEDRVVVAATVVAASIISAAQDDATVLLFVNQETRGRHLAQPRVDLNRVVVTLRRDDGDWLVTALDAL